MKWIRRERTAGQRHSDSSSREAAPPAADRYPRISYEQYAFSNPEAVEAHDCLSRHGFVLFRSVLDTSTVARCRALFERTFGPGQPDSGKSQPRTKANENAFLDVLRIPSFRSALRNAIGSDVVLVNEMSLHDSNFGGWHTDTTSPETVGRRRFHLREDFRIFQCGIYLQENSLIYGGGLDVVAGSHQFRDPIAAYIDWSRSGAGHPFIHEHSAALENGMNVANLPGDLVIFNLRLFHRATPRFLQSIDPHRRKFAYFFVAGCDNNITRAYREWLDQYADHQGIVRPAEPSDHFVEQLQQAEWRMI